MDFTLTDDRRMLDDTLTRWLADRYGPEHRRAVAYAAPWHDPERWAELAELGVLGALVPERHGGFGGSAYDVLVVFEALGRGLCPEPMLAQLIALKVLMAAGEDVTPLIDGSIRGALAVSEPDAPYGFHGFKTTTTKQRTLSGRKSAVYGAPGADRLLIVADDLWVYEADKVTVEAAGMIDGGPIGEVFIDEAPAVLVLGDAKDAVLSQIDRLDSLPRNGSVAVMRNALPADPWLSVRT